MMENRIMKKTFKDYGYESLLPFGEPAQDINRKKENDYGGVTSSPCAGYAAGQGVQHDYSSLH